MNHNEDYVFYEDGMMMNSKQPMKQLNVAVVGTKNYVFYVPKKTVGLFLVLNTIKTHQLFEGVTIEEGVRKLVSQAANVDELEKSMIALLEDDEKYVYEIANQKSFKFRGFLGKHSLRTSTGGANWSSITVNGKGNSKQMRSFYGQ